jgi:hypothetical protein
MKYALSIVAAISLLMGNARFTPAQSTDADLAQIRLHAIASIGLAQHWIDWRDHGPENGGICVLGNLDKNSDGVLISNVRSVTRVARLSGCDNERTIGAAILVPSQLFEEQQLTELACAAVQANEDWVVFGIITGAERKLLDNGQVVTVAQGLWCTVIDDSIDSRLASLP